MNNASFPVSAHVYGDIASTPALLPDALGARSPRPLFDHRCHTRRRRTVFR